MRSTLHRVCRTDHGMAHVELAIGGAALLVLLGLVAFAGRTAELDTDLQTAAAVAARAASRQATHEGATAAATAAAAANLDDAAVSCADMDVAVTAESLAPGGVVTVTIQCNADFSALAPLAMPGQRSFEASASEVVDTYRGG